MCGEGARCSRVEVAGVKDPIPLAPARILEPPFSGDSGGTTCPVVKPNTKLDIQLQIQASLTCVECSGGGGGGGGRQSERGVCWQHCGYKRSRPDCLLYLFPDANVC